MKLIRKADGLVKCRKCNFQVTIKDYILIYDNGKQGKDYNLATPLFKHTEKNHNHDYYNTDVI